MKISPLKIRLALMIIQNLNNKNIFSEMRIYLEMNVNQILLFLDYLLEKKLIFFQGGIWKITYNGKQLLEVKELNNKTFEDIKLKKFEVFEEYLFNYIPK